MFVPLHAKSRYSIGLGTAAIPALVQHAGRAGSSHLALTDVENVCGQVQLHAACRAAGLKPITGVELRAGFAPRRSLGARRGRVVMIARDARGYASLCRIVTRRRTALRDAEPPLATLLGSESALDGAFMLSDDAQVLDELVRAFGPASVRALLVRPRPLTPEGELVATARRLGVALCADVDAALLDPGDAALQQLACAAHLDLTIEGARAALGADAARVLPPPAAIDALFADAPAAVKETRAVAEACTLDLLAPSPLAADASEQQRELERRCRHRLAAIAAIEPALAARRAERLDAELGAIERLGLTELFMSVALLIDTARERGIPIAARGSAVSSFAGYLLGLSPIDPLAHGLYFERFASSARQSPSDIDLDVASRRRDELVEWLLALRGPLRAARVGSIVSFRKRSAHRAALRALGAPPEVIRRWLARFPPDELAGAVPGPSPRALPAPWRASRALLDALIELPRHLALHPGGVALSAAPLGERAPLERARSGAEVTQYDAASLARLGVVKVDLLGSHVLDEIGAALDDVRQRKPVPAWALAGAERDGDPASLGASGGASGARIPLDDAATLATIDRAETVGCFQLESPALRSVLARLPVRSIADVTHALAIVRPGPASGRAKELFIARARGEALDPAANDPLLHDDRRRATHGLLLYEEDILCVLSELGGLSLETAEALRARLLERADDAPWLERVRRRFLARTRARGIPPGRAERAWSDVLRFLRYSFNQAHTLSQALLGYQTAFLKTHAPLELGRALLDHHGGLYPRRVVAAELARRGVVLLGPSITSSAEACSIHRAPAGDALRIGLALIRRLRLETRQRILEARAAGNLATAADLLREVRPNPRELRALIEAGAADELLGLHAADYPWLHEVALQRLLQGDTKDLEAALERTRERLPVEPAELVDRYRRLRRVQRELEHLGVHVSEHPLRILRGEATRVGCVPSHRLREHVGDHVHLAGIIAATRRVPLSREPAHATVAADGAREGDTVAITQFITLEDEHGLTEARLSPAVHERLQGVVTTPGPYLVEARVREHQGAVYLAVESLLPFHERPSALDGQCLRARKA